MFYIRRVAMKRSGR